MTMAVDVPPRVQEHLGDPSRPLWLTEGIRKADAAVTAGLDCLALLGVWNWRSRNTHDGLTTLAFWESVALTDRRVYICFDSDVMLKRSVHAAMVRLGAFQARRGATVAYAYLPSTDGAKVGFDDYPAAGGTVADLVTNAKTEPLEPEPEEEPALAPTARPAARPAAGGRTLSWSGKLGLVACCTSIIDRAHEVRAAMGDRFLLVRIPDDARADVGRQALSHCGEEATMRAELSTAIAGLVGTLGETHAIDTDVENRLIALATWSASLDPR